MTDTPTSNETEIRADRDYRVRPCGDPAGFTTVYYELGDGVMGPVQDVPIWHWRHEWQALDFIAAIKSGDDYQKAADKVRAKAEGRG